jgi:hypothetical protein
MIKSRMMRWASHVAGIAQKRNAYMILTGKSVAMMPSGRHRRRWEDDIK